MIGNPAKMIGKLSLKLVPIFMGRSKCQYSLDQDNIRDALAVRELQASSKNSKALADGYNTSLKSMLLIKYGMIIAVKSS